MFRHWPGGESDVRAEALTGEDEVRSAVQDHAVPLVRRGPATAHVRALGDHREPVTRLHDVRLGVGVGEDPCRGDLRASPSRD